MIIGLVHVIIVTVIFILNFVYCEITACDSDNNQSLIFSYHSFVSYAAVNRQTNRQTNKQTQPNVIPTLTNSVGVSNNSIFNNNQCIFFLYINWYGAPVLQLEWNYCVREKK